MELFTEASFIVASNGSFGINTDIFETNLVNQLIILVGVVVFGRDFLSESLGERQAEIISGVEDSEKRLNEATTRLAEAKKAVIPSPCNYGSDPKRNKLYKSFTS